MEVKYNTMFLSKNTQRSQFYRAIKAIDVDDKASFEIKYNGKRHSVQRK